MQYDFPRIVDDIRSFLHATDQTYTEPLRHLASEYAEACNKANERLRRCEEYLQRGMRSEAIQYAQAEPPLLDVVAVLDFRERMDWEQTAAMYGLTPPPRLRLETAEALNRAFAEEKPLEDLLRKHRRLALARAPLPDRLAILHKIWRMDAGNPVWGEDVVRLEQARFGQLREMMSVAAASQDVDLIFQVREELFGKTWTAPLPKPLIEEVARLARSYQTRKLQLDLERAGDRLLQAYHARRESDAWGYWNEWRQLSDALGLGPGHASSHKISPARQWLEQLARQRLDQQKRTEFNADLERLEAALRAQTPPEQLRQLYAAVLRHRRPIPKATLDHYFDQMGEIINRREWRDRYILAAVFAGAALLLFGFFVWMNLHKH
jgi:hypothetical protein